ncbi:hypothetical protein F4803DRAFT_431608 [Xylaria telfairii]|nr:hypothetical protein F4803DRAFT_431608 [Xylaria telfairii]
MSARRRQNSSVGSASRTLPHHTRQKSKAPLEPKSAHVSDPFLQRFLGPTFNAADYLNSTLPSLQTSPRNNDPSLVPLAELSAQAQTQLSQLNAHTTRLTNTLTQLTDEILRSGSRLAYEVELLRGEALSLSELLTDTLHDDVVKFVPGGLQEQAAETKETKETKGSDTLPSQSTPASQRRISGTTPVPPSAITVEEAPSGAAGGTLRDATDPAFISQLQTLTFVRSRLDTVVKTFGDAMEFVFPPSELSVSSSFLSVSAPEPGSEDRSTEEKGQKVLKQFREEISGLLNNAGSDPVEGIEKAAQRIEKLKELTTVWNGTAEEKGRTKFIDSLAKMVEDRHKELMREMEAGRRDGRTDGEPGHRRSANGSLDAAASENRGLSGYGIMSQLQRLRTGL